MNINSFVHIILTVTAVAAVVVIGLFSYEYLVLKKQEVNNEARFQCAQSSRYQTTSGKATVWYPAAELYTACLKEKGL